MAFSAPRTWVVGELVTAAIMNTFIRDNQIFLAQQEVWSTVTHASVTGVIIFYGSYAVARLPAAGDSAYISLRIPANFGAIVSFKCIVIPRATQVAADWDLVSNYAAEGEAYQTHAEADAVTTYNVTNNQVYGIDISGVATAIAAGDIFGLRINLNNDAHDLDVVGLSLIYTVA